MNGKLPAVENPTSNTAETSLVIVLKPIVVIPTPFELFIEINVGWVSDKDLVFCKIVTESILPLIKDTDKWILQAAHDSYKKKYNIIHERQIEFFSKKLLLREKDILEKKTKNLSYNFEIRFHLHPKIKATKTIDNKSILLEL